MPSLRLTVALLAFSAATALRVSGVATLRPQTCARRSPAAPLLKEGVDGQPASDQLPPEQIRAAADAASAPEAWPESQAPTPGGAPVLTPEEISDGFDPRIILYVSLPALVLLGQLFFTFSRDALGDAALGPAVMNLYIP